MDEATFGKKFICEVKNLNSVYSKLTAELLPVKTKLLLKLFKISRVKIIRIL